MKFLNSKLLQRYARAYLSGKLPHRKWIREPECFQLIVEMSEKIRRRRERRGQFKSQRTFPNSEYHYKNDRKGSCSYCWPELASIHYRHGRVSRRRITNPKHSETRFGDWQQEYEDLQNPEMWEMDYETYWDEFDETFTSDYDFLKQALIGLGCKYSDTSICWCHDWNDPAINGYHSRGCLRACAALGIDPSQAFQRDLDRNRSRYPGY